MKKSVDYNDSMPIHLLSPEVSSQIAAGEVIERPASVVKELVENALDAGALNISISVMAAGRHLIEVSDDGSGIQSGELDLAVSRHATSKLLSAADLFHIATLGFRGEALASIASVSRLTITSRVEGIPEGARLRVEGGKLSKVEAVGAPRGTLVRVEDLFFNVPARLKFLKTDITERRLVDALLTRYSLAYPHVRFKLVQDNSLVLQTAGNGDRREILAALYGVEAARQLLEIQAEDTGIKLSGYISPTTLTRSNRKDLTVFVNGRWVQDIPLTTAIIQAYHTLLMVGRFPLGTIFIEMDPEDVDVNVHPSKAEVRFRNQDRVFGFVLLAVRRGLLAFSPVPDVTARLWNTPARQVDPAWELGHETSSEDTVATVPAGEVQIPVPNRIPLLRLIGQIGSTYVVAEGPDGLYLVDQHAAHERILFEKLMGQHERKNMPAQSLLDPAVITLPPDSARLLVSQIPTLQHLGFAVEEFGPNTFQVRSMPALFASSDPSAALQAVVGDFEEDEEPLQAVLEKKLAARICKRLAVKAGQTLSTAEQQALLVDLEACDSPRTCPHGRPTMIHLSVEMLERQFGRRGPQ